MPSDAFNLQEALMLGGFVQAAYDLFLAGDPPNFTPPAGYQLVSKIYADDITDNLPDYFVFGYVARSGSDAVVAIRGTETVFEWLGDVQFSQVTFPYVDAGKAEQGFTGFYSTLRTGPSATQLRVLEALRTLVADGTVKTLRITGHSLGAALATFLAIDVAGNDVLTPTVYTFASPAVGDKVFAGIYDGLVPVSWRIANAPDIVPKLPPFWAGYVHVDAEVPINSDDKTKHTLACWHSLQTYLNTLDPTSTPMDVSCVPA
ncbi:MAG TPA: lipase family protein [Gemmataceae bacterium]|nr:lipase family protein [Gemmataceae bacterium]